MADDIKVIIGVDSAPVQRAVQLMNNLESEVRDVEKAEKKGLITRARATEETKRLTNQMARLKKVSSGSAKDFYKFEKALSGSGKAARRNEVAIQQAGYQFQDFVVQVQGGVNPLIAFSQQGSQLAGFFAGPWGAAIGLGIAVLGSLGMAIMSSVGTTEKFEDQIKETTSTLDEYFNLMKSNSGVFSDAFEKNLDGLKLTSQAAKDLLAIARIEAYKGVESLNASLTASVLSASYLKTEVEDVGNLINKGFIAKVSAGLGGKAGSEIRSLYKALVQLREAPTLEGQYEAALRARDVFKQNVDVTGELTDSQRAFWKELSQTIQQMELLGAVETFDVLEELVEKTRVTMGQVSAEATTLSQEVADAAIELGLGYKEALKLQEEMKKAEGYALGITKADMESGILAAAAQAMILAKNMGISLGLALDLVALAGKSQAENLFDTKVRTGAIPPQAAGDFNLEGGSKTPLALQTYMDSVDSRVKEREKVARKAAKGAGKSPTEGFAEYLDGLKQQAQLEKELVGIFGAKRAEEEAVIQAREKYGEVFGTTQEAELRGTLRQIEADKERQRVLEEAKAQQEQLASMIAGQMGDAFMSIVDGTKSVKDAFKDMARAIIKELYQIFVIKKITGFIEGAIGGMGGSSLAPTSSVRPQIRPFANGGVVGGPTTFPMAGGKTGLMGEAGPEAIMPLKRGANGKLGVQMEGNAGGDVIINQSFNFQANGDDSVKRIIQQQIPRITEATKAAVVDSKRRGGSYGRAFG